MTQIIAGDIGGTNARFVRATLDESGLPTLGTVRKYKVSEHPSLTACWRAFVADEAGSDPLPQRACFGLATAIEPDLIKFTNSDWVLRPERLAKDLGLEAVQLVNDFEAIGHGIAHLPPNELDLLFGPDTPLPKTGVVSVLGPGTGLGVGLVLLNGGAVQVIATEGGHIDFAPLDQLEGRILDALRSDYRRVSVERIISGPGLNNLYTTMARINGAKITLHSDADLWAKALADDDPLARAALERLCLSYGAVAGDIALAQGAHSVVLAGGLTQRMRHFLVEDSGFHARFVAKGRFEQMMRSIPVRLVTHDEIGLFGAAAAFRET